MSILLTLLATVASLLATIQSSPTISPELRAQALGIAQQAIVLSTAQLKDLRDDEKEVGKEDANDMTDEPTAPTSGAGASAPAGTVDFTLDPEFETPTVHASGYGDQILARITIENGTDEDYIIGPGSVSDIQDELGVSLEGLDADLSFLYIGKAPKHEQYSIARKKLSVAPGAEATIEVRLPNPPGAVESFTLKVGSESRAITVSQ